MLLETSIAKTISTPSLWNVSILVPIFGFIKAIINMESAALTTRIFKTGFDIEIFGLNFSRLDFEKNNFCVLLFHNLSITNNRPIKAISKNIQDQEIFSNSYII